MQRGEGWVRGSAHTPSAGRSPIRPFKLLRSLLSPPLPLSAAAARALQEINRYLRDSVLPTLKAKKEG
jgi:hypothetical protein